MVSSMVPNYRIILVFHNGTDNIVGFKYITCFHKTFLFVEVIAFDTVMRFWEQAMNDGNYTAAASVYAHDALMTGPHGTFQGTEEIQGFFASTLSNLATRYVVMNRWCHANECTFNGRFDFGQLGKFYFEITLDDGKIVKEVVTNPVV